VHYYRFAGLQQQVKAWIAGCTLPHMPQSRLAGSFADPAGFTMSGPFDTTIENAYDVAFEDFATGDDLGPYLDWGPASNDLVSLLRQHFDEVAKALGQHSLDEAQAEREPEICCGGVLHPRCHP
jgi:hypothetical protein